MPELVEVETIRRGLEREVLGRTLRDIDVKERVHLLKNCSPRDLTRRLIGRRLEAVNRRGKYLVLGFGRDSLILHLRMSGRLLLQPAHHTRLILGFGKKKLFFDDARRFGMLYLAESSRLEQFGPFKKLGIEPLSANYSLRAFREQLRTRQEIKRLLLIQQKIAGLGNIYANEALFDANIHPQRQASSLSRNESERLFGAIPLVLERALRAGGTSIDSYRTPLGELGSFQEKFSVYDRAGKPCRRCQTLVKRITQGGRSSYFCPQCQPRGKSTSN